MLTPKDAAHGSGNYGLIDNDIAVPGQDNWRWCRKCQALCFGASGGNCPAGGPHDYSHSGNYTLEQIQNGVLGQDNWRWCRKCEELTFAGGPALGACAAGGLHDHTGGGDYVLDEVPDCSALPRKIVRGAGGIRTRADHAANVRRLQVKQLQAELNNVGSAYVTCQSQQHNAMFDTVCDQTSCVSINAIYANIAAQLDHNVVGYAATVGRTLTYQSFGYARTTADAAPPQPFLPSTKIHVASVSKVLTALAAIRILEPRGLLDAAIGDYLPSDWTLDPIVAAITFRKLLGQRSGIKDYGAVTLDYNKLHWFFTKPVLQNNTQCHLATDIDIPNAVNPTDRSWCYSNYNFAIFRILLPLVEGMVDRHDSRNRVGDLAAAYVRIVRQNVFEPVGVFGVDTNPPANGTYALDYQFPGTDSGFDGGDFTYSAGGYGWYLSVEDIAPVLASLNKNDGRILTPAQLQQMLSAARGADGRTTQLGWDMLNDSSKNRWIEKNGGWGGLIQDRREV
jgi:CubicO group peptidase (beta-lactamase class C family)